jgi:hypothetical protein
MSVDHAQHPLIGRMKMACRIRAGGVVIDRTDDAEHPLTGHLKNSRAFPAFDVRQWLALLVAGVAGFGRFVDYPACFGGVGGETDAALVIENANALNAWLAPDLANGLEHRFAVVVQHLVTRAALDDVADAVCAVEGGLFQVASLEAQIEVAEAGEDHRRPATRLRVSLRARLKRIGQD